MAIIRGFVIDTLGIANPSAALICKDEQTALDTGEEETTTIGIPAGISNVKLTLVWTDPPGAELQSDLDLIVRHSNGAEWHGNMAAGSTDFDRNNNVEQVLWENVMPGTLTVIVRAFRITSKPQSYALVIRSQNL